MEDIICFLINSGFKKEKDNTYSKWPMIIELNKPFAHVHLWSFNKIFYVSDIGENYPLKMVIKYKKLKECKRVIPEYLRIKIFVKYDYKCVICQSTKNLSIDHIFPFSYGGLHCEENLQLLCRSCNSKKSNDLNLNTPIKVLP